MQKELTLYLAAERSAQHDLRVILHFAEKKYAYTDRTTYRTGATGGSRPRWMYGALS